MVFLIEFTHSKTGRTLEYLGIRNFIHQRDARNRPLSELHKKLNRLKSQIRCKIGHIFGCVENSMGGGELEYIRRERNVQILDCAALHAS